MLTLPEQHDLILSRAAQVLAHTFARHFPAHLRADVRQECLLAIAEAAAQYDPGRGVAFATFAGFAIRNALRHLFRVDAPMREACALSGAEVDPAEDPDERIDREALIEAVRDIAGLMAGEPRRRSAADIRREIVRNQLLAEDPEPSMSIAGRLRVTKGAITWHRAILLGEIRARLKAEGRAPEGPGEPVMWRADRRYVSRAALERGRDRRAA